MALEVRPIERGGERDFVTGLGWLFEAPGSQPAGWDRLVAEQRAARVIASPEAALIGAWSSAEQVVGVASVYLDILSIRFGQRASIEDLAVHSAWRSQGVGSMLLTSARKWAIDRGADYVFLESGLARTDAHRFYIREGALQAALAFRWTIRPSK